ncbi:hypothetical protein HK101_004347, partial [Irineochytrium annulatum]
MLDSKSRGRIRRAHLECHFLKERPMTSIASHQPPAGPSVPTIDPTTGLRCEERSFRATFGGQIAAKCWGDPAVVDGQDNGTGKKAKGVIAVHGGHGRSDHLHESATAYLPWDHALALLDVLDALAWPQAHLLSHSMGAHISLLLTSLYPTRIASLTLLESLGHINRVPSDVDALRSHLSRARATPTPPKVYATVEDAARERGTKGVMGGIEVEAAMALCRRGVVGCEGGGYRWSSDRRLTRRAFFSWSHESWVQVCTEAARCEGGVMLVMGRQSAFKDWVMGADGGE